MSLAGYFPKSGMYNTWWSAKYNAYYMQPAQVKAIIEQTADDLGKPGMDDYYGRGRINAYKAVAGIKKAPAISRGRVTPAGKLTATWGKLKASR
jgi:hypothetical protein